MRLRPIERAFCGPDAVRGAVQAAGDTRSDIAAATVALMTEIVGRNRLRQADLVSAIFSVTADLTSELPPLALRDAGWRDLPVLCAAEMASAAPIPRVIRVLVHVRRPRGAPPLRPVYLPGTTPDRPHMPTPALQAEAPAAASAHARVPSRREP